MPVVDDFGRVAATILPAITINDAWWQLANFPMPPDDENLANDDSDAMNDLETRTTAQASAASYPVRQMMELVENIAAKQTAVSQADWPFWCTRFEECLIQAAGSPVLGEFSSNFKLNPLSPLWHKEFRPDFAATAESNHGKIYEAALKRVEEAWKVDSLNKIGAPV